MSPATTTLIIMLCPNVNLNIPLISELSTFFTTSRLNHVVRHRAHGGLIWNAFFEYQYHVNLLILFFWFYSLN